MEKLSFLNKMQKGTSKEKFLKNFANNLGLKDVLTFKPQKEVYKKLNAENVKIKNKINEQLNNLINERQKQNDFSGQKNEFGPSNININTIDDISLFKRRASVNVCEIPPRFNNEQNNNNNNNNNEDNNDSKRSPKNISTCLTVKDPKFNRRKQHNTSVGKDAHYLFSKINNFNNNIIKQNEKVDKTNYEKLKELTSKKNINTFNKNELSLSSSKDNFLSVNKFAPNPFKGLNRNPSISNAPSLKKDGLVHPRKTLLNCTLNNDEYKKLEHEKYRIFERKDSVEDSLSFSEGNGENFYEMDVSSFTIDPDSNFKVTWDYVIMLIIFYYLIIYPFFLSYKLFFPLIIIFCNIIFDVIFILDLILNFFVGYYTFEEELVRNLASIAQEYVHNFLFYIDIICSIPLGIITYSLNRDRSTNSYYNLLLLFKLIKISNLMEDNHNRNYFNFILFNGKIVLSSQSQRMLKFLFGFLVISHTISCLWIFFANVNPGNNWIITSKLQDESFEVKYLTSIYFHWVSIFTIGYGDIIATNIVERFYNCLLLFVGILIYSFTISSLGSMLASRDDITSKYEANVNYLEELRSKYNIPENFYVKLLKHLQYNLQFNKLEKYAFIHDLPNRIKIQLLADMYKEIINNCSFFKEHSIEYSTRIVHSLRPIRVFRKEKIVSQGEFLVEIYFIKNGIVSILLDETYLEKKVIDIRNNEYFGDILVETNERCPFNLKAATKLCDLFVLKKEDFNEIKEEFPEQLSESLIVSYYNYQSLLEIAENKKQKILEEINQWEKEDDEDEEESKIQNSIVCSTINNQDKINNTINDDKIDDNNNNNNNENNNNNNIIMTTNNNKPISNISKSIQNLLEIPISKSTNKINNISNLENNSMIKDNSIDKQSKNNKSVSSSKKIINDLTSYVKKNNSNNNSNNKINLSNPTNSNVNNSGLVSDRNSINNKFQNTSPNLNINLNEKKMNNPNASNSLIENNSNNNASNRNFIEQNSPAKVTLKEINDNTNKHSYNNNPINFNLIIQNNNFYQNSQSHKNRKQSDSNHKRSHSSESSDNKSRESKKSIKNNSQLNVNEIKVNQINKILSDKEDEEDYEDEDEKNNMEINNKKKSSKKNYSEKSELFLKNMMKNKKTIDQLENDPHQFFLDGMKNILNDYVENDNQQNEKLLHLFNKICIKFNIDNNNF